MSDDRRLIEDYLPIEAISREASREKSVRKGHISTLHLWWARRPLVACRAAVYGALAPASQFVPANGPDNKKQSLGRANAAKFVTELCKYPGNPRVIQQAQEHILEAHAQRLTAELAEAAKTGAWPAWVDEFQWPKEKTTVTRADIEAGRAPRPRVLDMFAGGGSIPLEALRLGCEAYAMDLNPVAYIIELCTLVYPQKYGKPDPTVPGMTGPKGKDGKPTWGGLANEVRYWGNWVLERVRREIGDLYPPIPDPAVWDTPPEIAFDRATGQWNVVKPGKPKRGVRLEDLPQAQPKARPLVSKDEADDEEDDDGGCGAQTAPLPPGFLQPVAYLWTRTVRCKNPACGATVPLVRQTWLCKKKGRYVALKMVAPRGKKQVRFEVVESDTEKGLGFDPAGFSKAGNATCPFCGTVADSEYVMSEGCKGRTSYQCMSIVALRLGVQGKVYLAVGADTVKPDWEASIRSRLVALNQSTGIPPLREPISSLRPSPNARGLSGVTRHGFTTFGDLFTDRQSLTLTALVDSLRQAIAEIGNTANQGNVVAAYLGLWISKTADYSNRFCMWLKETEAVAHMFARHAISMLWDFAEINPFGTAGMNLAAALDGMAAAVDELFGLPRSASPARGNAMQLPYDKCMFDAVITDPPYYDNVPYAEISDVFYVWLKRAIGSAFSEHFAGQLSPKKDEVTALASRHLGDADAACREYEERMFASLVEAGRVLKPACPIAIIYAHKTSVGWSTLVEALRQSGFVVTEAWPLNTERGARLLAQETAALASSIFLVGRKRGTQAGVGNYEQDVQPELAQIVRERVETLWEQGITGADLVIACVGAGLRAFTKYERVEYANGEEVPAERFLAEVEAIVRSTIRARRRRELGARAEVVLAALDCATDFYVDWRSIYRTAWVEAGEAIVFAYGTGAELDGPAGLSAGPRALLEKKGGKYRLRDYSERGHHEKLGLPSDRGEPAPVIDVLHRVLWLMENRPRTLGDFLHESRVNREQLRLVAQELAGPALKGSELPNISAGSELAALAKLTANWQSVVEDSVFTPAEQADRRRGQPRLFE